MSNHKKLVNFCTENNDDNLTLGIPTSLIKLMNWKDERYGIQEAVFLSQSIFWSDKSKRTDGYFYKSDNDWKKELCLTRHKLERMRNIFISLGYIEIKLIKAHGAPTNHYRVNMDKIFHDLNVLFQLSKLTDNVESGDVVVENQQMDMKISHNSELLETDNSLTENTKKIHHSLELTDENNKPSSEEKESYAEESKHIRESVYDKFLDWAMNIFPNEVIDDKKQQQLRSIIDDMNCCSVYSPMYLYEKPDYAYIVEKFMWASKTARDDPDFSFYQLISALTNPDNLVKHHNYHKKIIKRYGFDKDRICHPSFY